MEKILQNPELKYLIIEGHTNCGYINFSIKIEKLFRKLRELSNSKILDATKKNVNNTLNTEEIITFTNEIWSQIKYIIAEKSLEELPEINAENLNLLSHLLEDKDCSELLKKIVSIPNNADNKNEQLKIHSFIRLLRRNGHLKKDKRGSYCIEPVSKVFDFIEYNTIRMNEDEEISYLVTEEFCRQQVKSIREIQKTNKETNKALKEDIKIPKFISVVKSLETHGVHLVPEELNLDAFNMMREKIEMTSEDTA
ncbi:MAG: hypothetical protein ACOZBG_01410 [Candidatus Micrarchaeota archaeon]